MDLHEVGILMSRLSSGFALLNLGGLIFDPFGGFFSTALTHELPTLMGGIEPLFFIWHLRGVAP